eukprot:m.76547 g.76547  ORF g.76547 m.76547 type:complete len:581 (+) comp14435_c0_seq1:102-1844(+)
MSRRRSEAASTSSIDAINSTHDTELQPLPKPQDEPQNDQTEDSSALDNSDALSLPASVEEKPVVSIDVEPPPILPVIDTAALTGICAFCLKTDRNLISCSECQSSGHIKCLKLEEPLASNVRKNPKWLCMDCKTCTVCRTKENDDNLLFCDNCDDAVHMYCTKPRIKHIPRGAFHCHKCLDKGILPVKKTNKKRKGQATPGTAPPSKQALLSGKTGSGKRRGRPPKNPGSSASTPANPTPLRRTARSRKRPPPRNPFEGLAIPASEQALFNKATNTAIQTVHAPPAAKAADRMYIALGAFRIKTWYSAAYPHEYSTLPTLYICEFCLRYFAGAEALGRHMSKCECQGHPPGDEIYREAARTDPESGEALPQLQLWEVDGKKAKLYCQNVCLLARLFLDHKTLYYDVEPFLFYVLTIKDAHGAHFIGYFSKEKFCVKKYNVSCILTLPAYMRQGFGKYLIHMSYLLTKKENVLGTPEKPLSHLGAVSYQSYWKQEVLKALAQLDGSITLVGISKLTGMMHEDIASTLVDLGYLQTVDGAPKLVVDQDELQQRVAALRAPKHTIDESRIIWTPFTQRADWSF